MSDNTRHEDYTVAAIHERDGCPDGEGCRYCDTREAKLAERVHEIAGQIRRRLSGGASVLFDQQDVEDLTAAAAEISRLESERSELQVEKVALERENTRLLILLNAAGFDERGGVLGSTEADEGVG